MSIYAYTYIDNCKLLVPLVWFFIPRLVSRFLWLRHFYEFRAKHIFFFGAENDLTIELSIIKSSENKPSCTTS